MRVRGYFTKALSGLKAGDEVDVRGPYGGFVYDAGRDRKAVLIAGGIGITPFISMIQFATTTHQSNYIHLIYACQNQDDIPFFDLLSTIEKANANFSVTYVIGSGSTDKLAGLNVATGRISPELVNQVVSGDYTDTSFFVCGPPPFMRAVTASLLPKVTPSTNIITEAFSQGPNRQTGKIQSFPTNIYIIGALGLALGSVAVMVSDFFKFFPSAGLNTSSTEAQAVLRNSRQADLDALVRSVPNVSNSQPVTDAVAKAIAAANMPIIESSPSSAVVAAPVASTPKPAPVSVPTTTTTIAATPPAPKCTTTQSGVTTCI